MICQTKVGDKEKHWPRRTNTGLPQQEVPTRTELGLIEIWKNVVASRQDIKTCVLTLENEANLMNRKIKMHPHCSNFIVRLTLKKKHEGAVPWTDSHLSRWLGCWRRVTLFGYHIGTTFSTVAPQNVACLLCAELIQDQNRGQSSHGSAWAIRWRSGDPDLISAALRW